MSPPGGSQAVADRIATYPQIGFSNRGLTERGEGNDGSAPLDLGSDALGVAGPPCTEAAIGAVAHSLWPVRCWWHEPSIGQGVRPTELVLELSLLLTQAVIAAHPLGGVCEPVRQARGEAVPAGVSFLTTFPPSGRFFLTSIPPLGA